MRFLPLFFLLAAFGCSNPDQGGSWPVYGGGPANTHYSALTQIDTANVGHLQKVWEYHTGDGDSMSQIQVNALEIDSVVYGVSPHLKLFALNAVTGQPKWVFDPAKPTHGFIPMMGLNACRGVACYRGADKNDQRLFYSVASSLYCIDALTGTPILSWGDGGKIDLHKDLGRNVDSL